MQDNKMKARQEGVSAVIPAFNEADHIGGVLSVLNLSAEAQEIIVVDDGSTDDTVEVVQEWQAFDTRIRLFGLPQNRGKGGALLAGLAEIRNDVALILDADLCYLRTHHLRALLDPVRQDRCDMTIGLFDRGRWQTDLTHRLFPFLSGQRCLRWPLFSNLYDGPSSGWSFETALNLHRRFHHLRHEQVSLPGVTHVTRAEKKQGLAGYWSHVRMWSQIAGYTTRFLLAHILRSSPAEERARPAKQDNQRWPLQGNL
jgi:glycosyltransferase involved in cell wall biosynthesis